MLAWFNTLPFLQQIGLLYVTAINIVTFFWYGIDKIKAHRGGRRISEKMLWSLALAGGSLGALGAMKFFRHKTRKLSFQAMLAVIFALQIALLVYFLFLPAAAPQKPF